MSKSELIKELYSLLPIDDDSLGQIIENAWKLSSQNEIFEYWTGLLGQSPDALDFIAHFTSNSNENSSKSIKSALTQATSKRNVKNPWNEAVKEPIKPKFKSNKFVDKTVSQLLDKPKPEVSKTAQKKEKLTRIENLKDVEDILRQLEVSNTDSKYSVCNCMARLHPLFDVVPNCLNCGKIICVKEGLQSCSFCGAKLINDEEKSQIIELLKSEKNEIEKSQTPNKEVKQVKSKPKVQKIQYNAGSGQDFWKKTDKLFDDINKSKLQDAKQRELKEKEEKELKEQDKEIQYYEHNRSIDSDLAKAKANLENLLNFQENSAERTKIIDNASDFELPSGSNLNIWSSSVEKALQLKKQQKVLREQQSREKENSGRGKRVLDITIGKDGKAVITEATVKEEPNEQELKEIEDLEKDIQKLKDAKNEVEFNSVWDYKKDSTKWERPTYQGELGEEDAVPEDLKNSERVQSNHDDLEELVTVI